MKGVFFMETILPSADLRNKYSEISKLCHETRKPIYITVNGRGDTVLMGITEYEQMKSELELLKMLAEAEEDANLGRVSPVEETFNSIRKSILSRNDK